MITVVTKCSAQKMPTRNNYNMFNIINTTDVAVYTHTQREIARLYGSLAEVRGSAHDCLTEENMRRDNESNEQNRWGKVNINYYNDVKLMSGERTRRKASEDSTNDLSQEFSTPENQLT
jgi:hypothetical protein